MRVYLNSRNGKYEATGEWNGSSLVVLRGSKVKMGNPGNFKCAKAVEHAWIDPEVLDSSGEVLKNISFKSPSTAAQFITKRSINGWAVWKTKSNQTLKELREK